MLTRILGAIALAAILSASTYAADAPQPPPLSDDIRALFLGCRDKELDDQAAINACQALRESGALNGENYDIVLIALVRGYSARRRNAEAKTVLEDFLADHPDDIVGLALLGDLLLTMEDVDRAKQQYLHILEVDPDHLKVLPQLAVIEKVSGRLDDAKELINRFNDAHGPTAGSLIILGTILQERGEIAASVTSFERAIALEPGEAIAYFNLGNSQRELGQIIDALHSYTKAIELDMADPYAAHINRGNIYREMSWFDLALADHERALTLSKEADIAVAYANIGMTFTRAGSYKEARDNLLKAIEQKSAPLWVFGHLSHLLSSAPNAEIRDGNQALSFAHKAIEFDDSFFELAAVAAAHAELGQCDDAVRMQRIAVELAEDDGGPEVIDAHKRLLARFEACQPNRFGEGAVGVPPWELH